MVSSHYGCVRQIPLRGTYSITKPLINFINFFNRAILTYLILSNRGNVLRPLTLHVPIITSPCPRKKGQDLEFGVRWTKQSKSASRISVARILIRWWPWPTLPMDRHSKKRYIYHSSQFRKHISLFELHSQNNSMNLILLRRSIHTTTCTKSRT